MKRIIFFLAPFLVLLRSLEAVSTFPNDLIIASKARIEANEESYSVYCSQKSAFLNLTSLSFSGTIEHSIARISMVHSFTNTFSSILACTYKFRNSPKHTFVQLSLQGDSSDSSKKIT